MMAPAPKVATQLISGARERAGALICALETLPNEPIEVSLERAAAAVQQYCAELLDELVASVSSTSSADRAAWVKQRYTELALDFATSVRDIETDAGRRHAVAQAVQYQILESELRLRLVLDALNPHDS